MESTAGLARLLALNVTDWITAQSVLDRFSFRTASASYLAKMGNLLILEPLILILSLIFENFKFLLIF